MTPVLSPRVSRILALGILVFVVIVTIIGVVQPLFGAYRNSVISAEKLRTAIDHIRNNRANTAALEAEIAQLRSHEQTAPGFLRSTNPALAAVELQEHLKGVVTSVDGELLSTQILPPRKEANTQCITLRGEMIADIDELHKAIYALESGSPMLFLDNIEISPRPISGPNGTTIESSLDIRFDLYGYTRSKS